MERLVQEKSISTEQRSVVKLGVALLQNTMDRLGLPESRIETSHINILSSSEWFADVLRFAARAENIMGFAQPKRIYVARGNSREYFSPAIIFKTLLHEEGHYVSMEFNPIQTYTFSRIKFTRQGLRVDALGMTFFRGFDEGSAEHFADFALRNSQHILDEHGVIQAARVTPHDKLSADYIDYYAFWDEIKKELATGTGVSEEQAEISLLRGMASQDTKALQDLEHIYGPDAIMMLGLYGTRLMDKQIFLTSIEHSEEVKKRNQLIRDYFMSDDEILAYLTTHPNPQGIKTPQEFRDEKANKVKTQVAAFSPKVLKAAQQLHEIFLKNPVSRRTISQETNIS